MRAKVILVIVSILMILAALTGQVSIAEVQRLVTDGLVSYWSFDRTDIQGDVAKDAWGSNNGTIAGNPKIVTGKVGEALEFDGVDQYVEVSTPTDGSLDFGTDIDFTITAWINVSEPPADQYTIVGKGDRGNSPRILFKITGEQAYVTLANEVGGGQKPDFTSNTGVVDGKWHYVALVADRDTATKLYVDGVMDAEGTASDATDVNTESSLFIGKSHQQGNDARRFFKGSIDEVCIYNKALDDGQMVQNMNAEGLAVKLSIDKLPIKWGMIKASKLLF